MILDPKELARLTEDYGGAWGINHTRRLLHLIGEIGEGQQYNADAVWTAAHLHDWGAYSAWALPGVDHALRSAQVAQAFLIERQVPQDFADLVLECIRLHHEAGSNRSMEAILLRDADVLDFLGVVGVLRDFSKNPKDLRKAYEISRKRRETLPGILTLEKARAVAVGRIREMDELFTRFERDSWGAF